MLQRSIIALLLIVGLMSLAACSELISAVEDEPEEQTAEAVAPDTVAPGASATSETVAQPLGWGAAEDENCIIPGMVITGTETSGVPCEPLQVEEEAEHMSESASNEETASTDAAAESVAAGAAEPETQALDGQAAEMAALAVNDLSTQLGVPAEEVVVEEVRSVTWPDSSMGCPQPDMMYAQMLQEGYLIRLRANGELFYYHSGGNVAPFLCEETMQLLPPDAKQGDEMVPPPGYKLDQPDASSD